MGRFAFMVIAGATGCGFAPARSGDAGGQGDDVAPMIIDAPSDADALRPMYASSDTLLYAIDVEGHAANMVGMFTLSGNPVSMDALAFAGGKLLGIPVSGDTLYQIDPVSAKVTASVVISSPQVYYALTVAPPAVANTAEPRIFAATNGTSSNVYRIAMDGTATLLGSFGNSMRVAGDLAWVNGVLYATLEGGLCNPQCIAKVDTTTGTASPITKQAPNDLWGLSGYHNTLWALRGSGEIDSVDVTTGALTTTFIASSINWWEGAE